ncbi:hypothetical protein Tco_0863983 [Tanacetum coccineum]
MSFGGRLTLVRSVLGSLLLYYFSLFRVPSSVIGALERVRKNFFWGGLREGKKFHGLNEIRVESDALWCKVIKSIYGSDGVFEGSRVRYGGVCTNIIRNGHELDELDRGFVNHFCKEVGDGLNTTSGRKIGQRNGIIVIVP